MKLRKIKKIEKTLTENYNINYLDYKSIQEIADLSDEVVGKVINSDEASFAQKFRNNKPQGVIITDTYNHPIFPIDHPRIDNSKMMLYKLKLKFQELYSKHQLMYLPWHFTIEMIEGRYVVFNTRPFDVRFPVNNLDVEKSMKRNNVKLLNDETRQFFKNKAIDIQECIHICIIGDSTKDIYTDKIYKIIGRYCIHPILQLFRLSTSMGHAVYSINMGDKFKSALLERYMKK